MRDISTVNWWEEFQLKSELLLSRGHERVDPIPFYRELFPVGSLQSRDGDGKGNMIVTLLSDPDERTKSGKRKASPRRIVRDDLSGLDELLKVECYCVLIAPISFFGKTHSSKNSHELFAVVVDIDGVDTQCLKNLLKQFGNGVQLAPTFLVNSGHGVHLYYLLKEPLPMYKDLRPFYTKLIQAFISRLWNDTSSLLPAKKTDLNGVVHGFRAVGSVVKKGLSDPRGCTEAYRISHNRYTLQDIWNSIPECQVDLSVLSKDRIPIDIAKILYPSWYKKKVLKEVREYSFEQDRRLYDWWKRKMQNEVRSGGRYFSIMALCGFGLKCGVSDREIRKDARSFLPIFEARTDDETNHFTMDDVDSALRALRKINRKQTKKMTRQWIQDNTKVEIKPQIRRNGRKQAVHLEMARNNRITEHKNGKPWKARESKELIVADWRALHPDGRKIDCIRETGLAKSTVYKHWGVLENERPLIEVKSFADMTAILEKIMKESGPEKAREVYIQLKDAVDDLERKRNDLEN